ncbi:hypothetical protein Vretifemale_11751 [Volvox reticuliferus]|uniref:Uncharacterized protein n=1 Tax=Volvox reticuliferus TaxID=1737510 RepID=A0A8J4FNU5_9CHLO|nr:hypothetical protein Vretifemale_11751 [Volvox reticuliferus]
MVVLETGVNQQQQDLHAKAEQLTQVSHLQARTAALEQQNQQLQLELRRCEAAAMGLGGSGGGSDECVLLPRIGAAAAGGSRPVGGGVLGNRFGVALWDVPGISGAIVHTK